MSIKILGCRTYSKLDMKDDNKNTSNAARLGHKWVKLASCSGTKDRQKVKPLYSSLAFERVRGIWLRSSKRSCRKNNPRFRYPLRFTSLSFSAVDSQYWTSETLQWKTWLFQRTSLSVAELSIICFGSSRKKSRLQKGWYYSCSLSEFKMYRYAMITNTRRNIFFAMTMVFLRISMERRVV